MATVYLETSFFSECVTIRTGAIDLGRRATSRSWWNRQSKAFDLFISGEVIRELSDPNFPDTVRDPALAMLNGLNALPLNSEVASLALLWRQNMSDRETAKSEPTAVDDVRFVREKIAQEDGGDVRKHIDGTNRIVEDLRAKLNVRVTLNEPRLAGR